MKLIKSYIRNSMIDAVIHALERINISHMSVTDIQEIGRHADREHSKYSMEFTSSYSPMVKVEILCRDEQLKKIISVISESARTGNRGDGIIIVSPVEDAIHIRTGERGDSFL